MLGFSLLRSSFQFVDIQYENGKPVVNQFAKRSIPVPFTQENIMNENSRDQFRQIVDEAVDSYQLNGPVTISLESRFALVKKFLIDLGTPEDQTEEQVNWEIRQILPEDSLPKYKYVYERLPSGFYANYDSLLLILFQKNVLTGIKDIFRNTPLSIQHIELDFLSALYGINRIFGIREQDFSVLADVNLDSVKMTLSYKGEFFDSHFIDFDIDSEETETNAFDSPEKLANLISKEIRRKFLDYQVEADDSPVEKLFIFGEKADKALVDHLENSPAREVVFIEPFKKLELNSEIQAQPEDALSYSSEYTTCVGSALRSVL